MSEELLIVDLVARLRVGDPDATALVFNRYTYRLLALARSRLDSRIRSKVDAADIVQSVYRSFFHRHADGQFELRDWQSLWGMLAVITLRKARNRVRHFRTAGRDARRETSLSDDRDGESEGRWSLPGREPTPDEAVELTDTIEAIMRNLTDRDRTVFELALQGHTPSEISPRVGCSERTVRRALERIKDMLEQANTVID